MYCKNCGTEQKEGQKFCPKCGEPFIVANDTPNQNKEGEGVKTTMDGLVEKAGELSQKGKSFFEDKVQPQIKEKVEEFKKIDWNEKKEQATSFVKEFINNPDKISMATKVVACIFALLFLLGVGFSASIIWYVLVAAMLYIAFMGIPKVKLIGLKKQYLSACVTLVLGFIIISSSSKDGRFRLFSSGPNEVCVSLFATWDKNLNFKEVSGSHGGECDANFFYWTKIITIPQGKMWLYKDYDVHFQSYHELFLAPTLIYYIDGREDGRRKEYKMENSRDIPIFRSGDMIKILTARNGAPPVGSETEKCELYVYFIEKDDDFSSQ